MILTANNLTYSFRDKVLLILPFVQFDTHGIWLVVGKNGAGKSLLLHLLSGRVSVSSGDLYLEDNYKHMMLSRSTSMSCYVRLMTDYFIGDEKEKVQNYLLDLSLVYHNFNIASAWQDVEKILKLTSLKSLRHEFIHSLSLGEQRRLSLARVLLGKPLFLFLDEPFTGLDSYHEQKMRALLKEVSMNCTIIMSGHNIVKDSELSKKILWVKNYSVTEYCTNHEIIHRIQQELAQDVL